jgi:hypothetical protein
MKRGCRKLHNEELTSMKSSQSIVRTINSRKIRWAWHLAGLEKTRNATITLQQRNGVLYALCAEIL